MRSVRLSAMIGGELQRPREQEEAPIPLTSAPRLTAAVLLTGALVLMLAFATSYVGAFHKPTPHRVPVALIAPQRVAAQSARRFNRLPGPLQVRLAASVKAAAALIDGRQVYGAYDATTDTLYLCGRRKPGDSDRTDAHLR